MGNLKCTCINNNESNQVIFENNNHVVTPKISLFELISKYYSTKNIRVEKISQDDFFTILNSDSGMLKILDEYEKLFEKYNIKINEDSEEVESIKFIDESDKVLVHCLGGISRSAAIVIAYFMWKDN